MFALAGRAVESGYDLRLVVRELARLDARPAASSASIRRASTDPEIAAEGERERSEALAARFSREDLMRAFDVLTKAEYEIRGSAQPRYHLEMALLRWIHLRKLVPLTELIQGLDKGGAPGPRRPARLGRAAARRAPVVKPPRRTPATVRAVETRRAAGRGREVRRASRAGRPRGADGSRRAAAPAARRRRRRRDLKDAFLAEMQKAKKFFYGTVVAQAQRIDVEGDRVRLHLRARSIARCAAARAEPRRGSKRSRRGSPDAR